MSNETDNADLFYLDSIFSTDWVPSEGAHFQRVKVGLGSDGNFDGDVSSSNPMPVSIAAGSDIIETSDEGNTALKVFVQDQTTPIIDNYFHQHLNETTLATNAVVDAKTVTLSSGHGAVVGNYIVIYEGGNVSEFEVLGVATDVITIDSPMDFAYTTSAAVQIVNVNMAVDGSTTPVIFTVDPPAGFDYDITRVILNILDTSSMDFSTFGSGAAITNGVVLRVTNGAQRNLFNWKTNGELINRAFDHSFQTNNANNARGFTVRSTFSGAGKRGVTVRLNGDDNDELQIVIQDDLTGQDRITMIAQGHRVQ